MKSIDEFKFSDYPRARSALRSAGCSGSASVLAIATYMSIYIHAFTIYALIGRSWARIMHCMSSIMMNMVCIQWRVDIGLAKWSLWISPLAPIIMHIMISYCAHYDDY